MKLFTLSLLLFLFSGITADHFYAESYDRASDPESDFTPLSVEKLWEMKRIGAPVIFPNGDSRLIYYPDENHWILKPNNSIYWYEQVRKWVEEYAEPASIR